MSGDVFAENQRVSYLQLTDSAKNQVKTLVEDGLRDGIPAVGIRISLKPKGCTGLKYAVEYAEIGVNISKFDDLVELEDIKIFIEPKISMWVIGTVMDYVDDVVSSGFVFKNPNEKGKCGCGESFYV